MTAVDARQNQVSGTVMRAYLDALDRAGMRDTVRAHVSPATGALMDHPPLATQWLDLGHTDEISHLVLTRYGRDKLCDFAYDLASRTTGKTILPLLKTTMLFGEKTPATLLANVGPSIAILMRGVNISYTALTPTSGFVTLAYSIAVTPSRFYGWQGVLRYIVEVCEVDTVVEHAVIAEDGRSCRLNLAWTLRSPKTA